MIGIAKTNLGSFLGYSNNYLFNEINYKDGKISKSNFLTSLK